MEGYHVRAAAFNAHIFVEFERSERRRKLAERGVELGGEGQRGHKGAVDGGIVLADLEAVLLALGDGPHGQRADGDADHACGHGSLGCDDDEVVLAEIRRQRRFGVLECEGSSWS